MGLYVGILGLLFHTSSSSCLEVAVDQGCKAPATPTSFPQEEKSRGQGPLVASLFMVFPVENLCKKTIVGCRVSDLGVEDLSYFCAFGVVGETSPPIAFLDPPTNHQNASVELRGVE